MLLFVLEFYLIFSEWFEKYFFGNGCGKEFFLVIVEKFVI